MLKLLKTTSGILLILVGTGGVIFTIYLFTQRLDIITAVTYISFIAIGLGLVGVGWIIISGGSVREALRDIFSGLSF